MDPLTQVKADLQRARADIAGLLAKATAGGRALTDEERITLADKQGELEKLSARLALEEQQFERDRTTSPAVQTPDGYVPQHRRATAEGEPGRRLYRDLFGPVAAAPQAGDGDFLGLVASGRFSPDLKAVMNEGVGSEGGFLTPTEVTAEAFDSAIEGELVRPRSRVFAMASDERRVAGFACDGGGGVGPYAFAPSWVGEGVALTPVTPLVRSVSLVAHKLSIFLQASNEVVRDGLSYTDQLTRVLTNAMSWSLDDSFLTGNGVGRPLGVLASPCLVIVAKEPSQAAGTIVASNILGMYSRLLTGSHKRAVWAVSPTALPQLYSLSIPSGTAGFALGHMPSFFDAGRMTLLGVPIIVSEKMAPLGDQGDLLLADFSYYAVGMRKEVSIESSVHVGFASDLASFRALLRCDGKPLLSTPYTSKNGVELSPFVTLEAR